MLLTWSTLTGWLAGVLACWLASERVKTKPPTVITWPPVHLRATLSAPIKFNEIRDDHKASSSACCCCRCCCCFTRAVAAIEQDAHFCKSLSRSKAQPLSSVPARWTHVYCGQRLVCAIPSEGVDLATCCFTPLLRCCVPASQLNQQRKVNVTTTCFIRPSSHLGECRASAVAAVVAVVVELVLTSEPGCQLELKARRRSTRGDSSHDESFAARKSTTCR